MSKLLEEQLTVKAVAGILEVSESFIREKVKELFPKIVQNGKTTYMNQYHITEIKKDIEKNPYLTQSYKVSTDLEIADKTLEIIHYWTNKSKELKQENEDLKKQMIEYRPKVEYTDNVLLSENLLTITQIAQDLGLTATKLNQILNDKGIIYKCNKQWIIKEKYKNEGYVKSKTHLYYDEYNKEHTKLHTYWTQKGRKFIIDLLKD